MIKYNIQPNEMVNSLLFKHVAPRIHSISHGRLLFELCLVSTRTGIEIDMSIALSSVFIWDASPQGFAFWHALNTEYFRNGA